MDVTQAGVSLLAQAVLGWVIQMTMRAPEKVHNWQMYAVLGVASLALFWLANREFMNLLLADPRIFIFQLVTFFLAARGAAGGSADAKMAYKTNSL